MCYYVLVVIHVHFCVYIMPFFYSLHIEFQNLCFINIFVNLTLFVTFLVLCISPLCITIDPYFNLVIL